MQEEKKMEELLMDKKSPNDKEDPKNKHARLSRCLNVLRAAANDMFEPHAKKKQEDIIEIDHYKGESSEDDDQNAGDVQFLNKGKKKAKNQNKEPKIAPS